MPSLRHLLLSALCFAVVPLVGCAAAPEEEEPAESEETAEALASGDLPYETIAAPSGAVGSWEQPDSEGWFGQYGYCGATAVANLLRWHGIEKSPQTAVAEGCWSYVGTTPGTLVRYLERKHAPLGCSMQTLDDRLDALTALRTLLRSGRPPVVLFRQGGLQAHWVVVVGVEGAGADPWIEFMSWGGYKRARWSELDARWRRAFGFHHPFVACATASPRGAFRTQ